MARWRWIQFYPAEEWECVMDALQERTILQTWRDNREELAGEIERTRNKLAILESYQQDLNNLIARINVCCKFIDAKSEEYQRERDRKELAELQKLLKELEQ